MLKVKTKYRHGIVAAIEVVLGLMILATMAFGRDGGNSGLDVFPPNSNALGKKYKEWTAEWWQFVLSFPPSENPVLDATGEKCVVGQHGPVWFLVGTFGPGTAKRDCSIPKGTALFFPVINSVNINTPNVCGQDSNDIPVDDLRALSASLIDSVTNLSVEVDGKPVQHLQKKFCIKSIVFDVTLPEDNVFDSPCMGAGLGNVPAGTYSPAVDDGFYVMLQPLSVGNHTLHIHAESPPSFSLDVTYNLTIVPVALD